MAWQKSICSQDVSAGADAVTFAQLVSWAQSYVDNDLPPESRIGLPRIDEVLQLRSGISGDRTVVARRDLKKGELLMRLPMSIMMHAGYFKHANSSDRDTAHTSGAELAAALHHGLPGHSAVPDLKQQTWLALYIMEHQQLGEVSKWSPYLNSLPKEFSSNPIFYTDEDWQWLQGSTHLLNEFKGSVIKRRESWKEQFDIVTDLIPGFAEKYTLEEFLRARAAISSRVFDCSLPTVPREDNKCMLPLGDMLNHGTPNQVDWEFNKKLQTMDFSMQQSVSEGEELFNNYGTHNLTQGLMDYGFVPIDIQPGLSTVKVKFFIDQDMPDREQRERRLAENRSNADGAVLSAEEFELRAAWRGSDGQFMIGYARLLSLPSGDEFESRIENEQCTLSARHPRCDRPLNVENERAALKRCLQALQDTLAGYSTSLEDDDALLNGTSTIGSLDSKQRALVLLRRHEKVIVHWWVRYFTLALECLALSPKMILNRAGDMYPWQPLEFFYFRALSLLVADEGRLDLTIEEFANRLKPLDKCEANRLIENSLASILKEFDSDSNSQVSMKEILPGEGAEGHLSALFEYWKNSFADADANNDGQLAAREFAYFLKHLSREQVEELHDPIESIMKRFDTDMDGRISLVELLYHAGYEPESGHLSGVLQDWKAGFKDADVDNDRHLSAHEFVQLLDNVGKPAKSVRDDL